MRILNLETVMKYYEDSKSWLQVIILPYIDYLTEETSVNIAIIEDDASSVVLCTEGTELITETIVERCIPVGSLFHVRLTDGEIDIREGSIKQIQEVNQEYEYACTVRSLNLFKGQKLLVSAPPGKGKTTVIKEVANSYEKVGCKVRRILIGERTNDTLGPGTTNAHVLYDVGTQYNMVLEQVALSLRDAHKGIHAVLAIDSLTRMVEKLNGLDKSGNLTTGGISGRIKDLISQLFMLGGIYGEGTLTMAATCLFNKTGAKRVIYSELKSISDAEIFPEARTIAEQRKYNYHRMKKDFYRIKKFGNMFKNKVKDLVEEYV